MRNLYTKAKEGLYRSLLWSQRYTKTDMIYLTKGMSWLTFGQVVSSASVFLGAIAFANLLPAEIYGNYKFVLSFAGILSIAALKGVNTSLTKSVAQGFDRTVIRATITKIKWSMIGVVGALGASVYYFAKDNQALGYSMLIVAVFTPLMDAFTTGMAYLQGKKLFGKSTKYFIFSQLFSTAVLISTLFLTDNLFIILTSYFASWLISRAVIYSTVIKKYLSSDKVDEGSILYGKKLSFINIIPGIATHIDKILLFHYLGAIELAVYSFAIAIPDQVIAVLSNIQTLALPKFSERKVTEIKSSLFKKSLLIFVVTVLIIAAYIAIAPIIYEVFFPQYLESIWFSQIYMLAAIGILAILPSTALVSQEKTKSFFNFKLINSSVKIILLSILIFYYGIMGAILASVISKVIAVFLGNYFLFRRNN